MRCGNCGNLVGVLCRCLPAWLGTDPQVRQAVDRQDLRTIIRLLRSRTRLHQGELASITGLPQPTISRLESGRIHRVRDRYKLRRALAGLGLIDPDPELVAAAEPSSVPVPPQPSTPVAPLTVDDCGWEADAAMDALHTALGYAPSRRTIMALAGSTLAAQVLQWALADPTQARRAREGGPVSDVLTDRLAQSVDAVRIADAQGGASPALRAMAQPQLEFLHRLLREDNPGTDRSRLLGVTADLAGLLGWMAVDAGEARAQALLLAALRTAHAAGDPVLGAGIISYLAVHTYSQGQGREAALMAGTALHRVQGMASPFVECVLWTRQARGHAVAGEERRARMALEHAFDAYTMGPCEDDPVWLYWVDEGELHGQAGSTLLELGYHDQALEHAEQALAGYSPECVRNQASTQIRAARALIGMTEVEQACDRAHRALDLVETLRSERTTGQMRSLLTRLRPHQGHAPVRELLERARPLVREGA